ncbi:hypothetical protein I4U23_015761 [Adineta vaga]|nr:hypothetical protein I4U23_015761 [Adineta vaga]
MYQCTGGEFNALYSTPRAAFLRRVLNYGINQADICSKCHAKAAFLAVSAAMTYDFTSDEAISTDEQFVEDDDQYGNNQEGDGSRYRRRGFFGLRGKEMYKRLRNLMPQYDSINRPESVAIVENSMSIIAQQWNNPNLLDTMNNSHSDFIETSLTQYADGTFYGFSMLWYKLGGDLSQLTDGIQHYIKFLRVMKCDGSLHQNQGSTCRYNATHNGICTPSCIESIGDFGEYCGCYGEQGEQCPNSPAHI